MSDAKVEADRLFRLMRSITFDKNDAKDCAVVCAQEVKNAVQDYGRDSSFEKLVIDEIKKI